MNRLALARTKVSGSITLQGNTFTFTASASGTGWDDNIPEAKRVAVAASNTAATVAARASIDKILTDNSAILTDLEITSLISTNLKTTVVVFRPIALELIAHSTDGSTFYLKQNATIGKDEMLTVPSGIKLIGQAGNPFTNYGIIQIDGSFYIGAPGSKALKAEISSYYPNYDTYKINVGGTLDIDKGVTFENLKGGWISNYGTVTNSGTIKNSGAEALIYNYITTSNAELPPTAYGIFQNNGSINNTGSYSELINASTFYNNGPITNSFNAYSDTRKIWGAYATWTTQANGSCSGDCY